MKKLTFDDIEASDLDEKIRELFTSEKISNTTLNTTYLTSPHMWDTPEQRQKVLIALIQDIDEED